MLRLGGFLLTGFGKSPAVWYTFLWICASHAWTALMVYMRMSHVTAIHCYSSCHSLTMAGVQRHLDYLDSSIHVQLLRVTVYGRFDQIPMCSRTINQHALRIVKQTFLLRCCDHECYYYVPVNTAWSLQPPTRPCAPYFHVPKLRCSRGRTTSAWLCNVHVLFCATQGM
jgi:hypothetical protein